MNRFENMMDAIANRATTHLTKLTNHVKKSLVNSTPRVCCKPLMWLTALLLTVFVAGCGGSDPILGVSIVGATGPAGINTSMLKSAAPFGIAATAGVTNTGTAPNTTINGNVVLEPVAGAICNNVAVDIAGGFGPCGGFPPTLGGTSKVFSANYDPAPSIVATVKSDLQAAFLKITPPAGPPAAGSLGGATNLPAGTTLGAVPGSAPVVGDNLFFPGVYQSLTSIMITGDLTLDAQGNPNAVFVFQSSSTLGTADGSAPPVPHTRILLVNGAKASNVWWQAGSSVTLGLYSEFQGNILAAASITMKTGSTSCGRLLAGAFTAGAFVFDANVVSVPGQPFLPPVGYSTVCQ